MRRDEWPESGPWREFLEHLFWLYGKAGRPTLAAISKNTKVPVASLSEYFAGKRMIPRDKLFKVVEFLGGELDPAESLWLRAKASLDEEKPPPPKSDSLYRIDVAICRVPGKRSKPEVLLGREGLAQAVAERLDAGRPTVLCGPSGIGKTAIAVTVADQRIEAGKGAYLWIRTGDADAETALADITRVLGVSADVMRDGSEARLLGIQQVMRHHQIALCVIDDVRRPETLAAILLAIPRELPVLITTQLTIRPEDLFEVEGLDPAAAAELLAVHAGKEIYRRQKDAHQLCHDLEHRPYAIELAGLRLRNQAMSPSELADDIDNASGTVDQRLVRDAVSTAGNAQAQGAMVAFTVFFSGTLTAELLAMYLEVDVATARLTMAALAGLGLIKGAPQGGVFEMHDSTRARAVELFCPDPAALRPRAIRAVRQFVASYKDDHQLLRRDIDNVLRAAEFALGGSELVAIVGTLAMCGFFDEHGLGPREVALLDAAIEATSDSGGDQAMRHLLLGKRGNAHFQTGNIDRAVETLRAALAIAPDRSREALVLGVIGKALAFAGDRVESDRHFHRAYRMADAEKDEVTTVRILLEETVAAFKQEDFPRLRELCEQGLPLSRRNRLRNIEATLLSNLGVAEFRLGIQAALARHTEAERICVALESKQLLAMVNRTLAADHHAQEKFDIAQHHYREALRLYEELGKAQQEAALRRLMHQFGYLK
jgi:tetratricopeptide (TPR) repeat protein